MGSAPAAMPRNDAGSAGGFAPDESEAAAAVAETFAKRSRREQALFDEAASASSQQRQAAYGREELRPPEEYLAVNWPMGGHQLYGPELMRDLTQTALSAGIEAKCRGRTSRHPSRNEVHEQRCPRLVLLGPRGKALEVALEFVKAAERILGVKRLRRARRYLTAAAGDERITEPDQHVEDVEVDSSEDSASSCSEDAGGGAPEDVSAEEPEADWGDDDIDEQDGAAAAASSSAFPSASASASSSETLFWAACKKALAQASGTNAARMRAVVADLEMQLKSMENGRLDWRTLQPQNLGEPKVALASHALNRDYQVKVALPLHCMALLRMRNVGHL